MLRPAGESSGRDAAAYRALDLAFAVPPAVVLSPVLAIIAAAIRIESRGPVLIGQRRLGLDFEPFRLLVFRTRRHGRVTRVGSFLERRGLHRLPSLLNVLRGEMSIVGPSPVRPTEIEHYPPQAFERFAVRPGLVCLDDAGDADISALEYVYRRSPLLNLRICARRLRARSRPQARST